jgi:hypothetical protein
LKSFFLEYFKYDRVELFVVYENNVKDFRFGGILEKIKEFFAEYVSILEEMLLGIDKVDFEDLIIDIEKYLNDFFNEDLVFKKVNITRGAL